MSNDVEQHIPEFPSTLDNPTQPVCLWNWTRHLTSFACWSAFPISWSSPFYSCCVSFCCFAVQCGFISGPLSGCVANLHLYCQRFGPQTGTALIFFQYLAFCIVNIAYILISSSSWESIFRKIWFKDRKNDLNLIFLTLGYNNMNYKFLRIWKYSIQIFIDIKIWLVLCG